MLIGKSLFGSPFGLGGRGQSYQQSGGSVVMMSDRTLYEQTPALLQTVDAAGCLVAVSDRWLQWLGYDRAAVIGRPWQAFLTPRSQAAMAAHSFCANSTAAPLEAWPLQFQTQGGEAIAATLSARWLAGDAAAPVWVATVTALTAPTAAELALAQCQARLAELERDRDTAQSAQQESERRFQLITETVSDAFWIDDTVTRRPIYSSPGFEGVWGLPATIIEDGFEVLLETVHPDDRQHFWQNLELSFASSQPTSFDFRIIHPPTGHIRWLSERCFPLLTADGRPHQMIGITSDITPRKEAELALKQSEERFRLLADNIQDVFWLTDLTTGQNLYVNPAFERTWQLSQATLQQEPLAFLSRVHPDDRDRLATELQAHWQAAENFEVEYRLLLPDGTIRWMRDRGTVIFDAAGHPTKMAGIATDITAAQQAAATLQQYERIIAASPDPVCLVGRDYTYRLTNRAFRDWFVAGADPTGQTISTVFDPEFFTRISQPRIDRALQGETQVYEEWAYNPRQPSPQFISITYIPYYEVDGTISGVISSARDLTALKQTRDRLAHTTERLQLHIQNSPLAVIEWDSHYRVQQWSAQAAAIFGWSAEEVMGRHFSEFPLFPATCLEGVYDHIETLLRSETHHQTVVSPNLTRDGQGLCCEWYNSALIDAAGNLVSVLSFVQDVTERHRTQAALKASEERWQLALLGSNEGIWDWQITTDELFYSPRWKGILGYGDDELSNTHEAWRSRVHPDDLALVNAAMRAHLTGQTAAYAVEYRMRHKSGDYVWILSRGRAIFDPPGHPVRFVGSHTDVSDRKHAELALRSSQQLLQLVFDNLPQRVFWKDLAGRFLGCNRAFAEDMGYCDPSEIVGKTDYDFDTLLTECVQGYREQDRQVIEADRPITFEEQIQRHQNGAQQWVSTTKLPLKTPQGELIGVFGSYEDISDRILARQSLQRYARMIEVAKDGICLLDRDYRYQIINRTYREWYGHNDQPILGQTVAEVLGTAAFEQRLRPLLDRCLQGETIRYASWFDFPHLGRRFRSITLTPYGEANGDITGIVTSIRDLTALKESESRQQELLEIIETTPDLVGMAWPDGKVFYLNPALTTLLTPPGGNGAIPDTIRHFHPQWAMTKILTEALPAAAAHGTWQGETAFLTGTGQEIPVSQTVTAHRDEQGDVKLYSTIARDISAQKALEQELRDRLEFEQLLSRLSTEFVNLPGDALVNGMTQALQEIAEATGAERSYVYLLSEDGTTAHLFSRWTAPHLPPNDDWVTVPVAQFPWWVDQLRQHQVIAIADTADLPPEAVNERRAVAAAGTRSHALVPMYHSQTLLGYIGFSVVTAPKAWSDNEITLLRLVGDLFSNAYQRQQVEGALRQQEHYFRSLTEQSSDIVVLLDETGQVKYITPSATRLLGYPLEEMQGAAALAFIAPEDVERVAAMLQQAAAQPGVSQPIVQYRLRHQDQQWRYYEAIATSLLHDPVVQGIVVNCRDVSDRIGAETARRLSEQVFKGIFEQAAISMAQIALDGTYIRVNPAFCELVGYPAAELIGAHYAKVTHPDDLAHDIALSDEVVEGKVTAQFINKRFVRSDGTIRHVKVVVTAVQGDSNTPAFLASVYNDVTEQVMAEGALRSILEGTASVIGEDFFPVLAQHLAQSLHVDHVLINQLNPNHTLTNLVFWSQAQLLPPFSFTAVDTPCERTLQEGFYCCPEAVQAAFPDDPDLVLLNAESYLGMALISAQGETLGEICALHSAPMHDLDGIMAILRIFGARVSAELERQQSNAALKANESNWRNILDNMPILLNAVDRHGCFTLWNQECERVTGYSAAEMIGNPHALEMLYPDPRYRQTQMQAWAERGNNYRNWEWKITCKNGRERTIAWSNLSDLFPIPDLGAWGIGVDVTDRRQAENALRKSEKRFQRLAANMPGVIYRYRQFPDGRDRFSYVSPGSRDLWELDPDAVCIDASLVWSLVHPEDMERFAASIEQAIASGGQWFHEHRIITPSGQHKWIQAVARAEHKKDGSLTWDGVLIDVTARKLAELAFQASEDRFQRLAVNMPGIILRYHRNAEGGDRLSYLSPASREIWEVEPAAALADIQLVWQLIHPDDLAHLQAAIATSQTQLTPLVEDYRIITSTGRLKWLKLVARPVQDAPGQCLWDGLIIDVTEQKKTQQALQQSESLNRAIIEALPDLLIRMRRDGLCLDMHYPIWFNVVWPKERHVGHYIQEVIAPDVAAQRLTATALALTTQQTQVYDYQIPVNGEARWEEARVVPLAEDEVLVLIRDIHDRKQAEAALRESEALNRAIVEALPDLLLRMSRDGVCLNMQNPDTFPVLENTRSAIGRNIRDMLPPDLVQQRLTGIQQALATQETQVAEYQLMVRGQPRWEESRIVPLMENEVLILVRDVDERRRAENEVRRLNQILEEQNQRLEDLVELRTAELLTFMNALPDQIFVVDRTQNKMTFGNDVVARFAAQGHRKRFEGKTVFECFETDRATYYEAQNRQVFDTGEILHVEEAIDTPDGIVYLDTYKIPLKQPDGQVYALIGTSRDVTELVTARQTLETQALQLEATNQELQSFSYSVSHDLRAPLRHINGFITALKQRLEATTPNPDPKIAHYIDVIEKSSQKMGLLIDGLLTLSRVGRREMTTCPVPLQPLAEHAIALLEDDPDSHGVQIHLDPLPTVPGDPTLLQQVFTNLISNAVKFSRDRRPAIIHIGHRPTDGAIFIQDNGVGFDMTYADKLFSPFQRLHKQEEFQGTGIGLAIVNRIIHRHGGHIWAESVIGEGTTFFFTLSPEPPLD